MFYHQSSPLVSSLPNDTSSCSLSLYVFMNMAVDKHVNTMCGAAVICCCRPAVVTFDELCRVCCCFGGKTIFVLLIVTEPLERGVHYSS